MPRVILNPAAKADFPQHFQIVTGSLLEALRVELEIFRAKFPKAVVQFGANAGDSPLKVVLSRRIVGARKDARPPNPPQNRTAQRIDLGQRFDLIAEILDANGRRRFVGREDIHDIAPHPERAAVKIHVVPRVLHGQQPRDEGVAGKLLSGDEFDAERLVNVRRADAVDA